MFFEIIISQFAENITMSAYMPGDRVKIRETRPLSAHKRWAIEEILNTTSQDKEVKK